MCGFEGELTYHHLIPKSTHTKSRKRKYEVSEQILLCEFCHKQIHLMFTNKELADKLNTIEKLKDKKIKNWLNFITKKNKYV